MKELKGLYHAMIIVAEGGSGPTHIACDNLVDGSHFRLTVVNEQEAAVTGSDGRYQRLVLKDLHDGGVQVVCDVDNNPILRPGEGLEVAVGSHKVNIVGAAGEGALFNGASPTKVDNSIRYPRV